MSSSEIKKKVECRQDRVPDLGTYTIGSFGYVEVVKNNGKEMYKKMCCTCKVGFISLLSPIDFFFFLLFAYLVAVTG